MVDEESSNPLPLSITTTTARYAPTPLPLIFKLVRPLSCLSWQNVYTPSCTEEGSSDREKKKEEEKDGSRKRGRVSRQRIISMTSKGVVISRPFLSARVFLHESGCEWRLRATPVIVLIQPYPSNHLLLSFSPSPDLFSSRREEDGPRVLLCHPTTHHRRPPTLLKHDFRSQTKRASVVYNEAPLLRFLAVVPPVVTFLLLFFVKNMAKFKALLLFLLFLPILGSCLDLWKCENMIEKL